MKVAILLAPGFEEVEALSVLDVLRRASVECLLVSTTHEEYMTSSHDVILKVDAMFENMDQYDAIVLPGGLPGATNLRDDERVIELIQKFNQEGKIIAAVCAGPISFAKANIIKGRKITSFPLADAKEIFKEGFYQEDDVVVDHNMITSRGAATSIAFGYAILEKLGYDSSDLKKKMMYRK